MGRKRVNATGHAIEPELLQPVPRKVRRRTSAVPRELGALPLLMPLAFAFIGVTVLATAQSQGRVVLGWFMLATAGVIFPLMMVGVFSEVRRDKRLVMHGAAVRGRVVSCAPWEGGIGWQLQWAYLPPKFSREVRQQRMLPANIGATLKPDDTFTVLCDPRDPERAVIYRFAAWEALP